MGKSDDGGIYNYEAIDAGQNFCGEIIGDEKLLLKLRDGLNLDGGKMIAYVGRSKFTQYGKCLLTFGEVENLPETNFDEKIFLLLDTPLVPEDENFLSAETVLSTEIADKLGEKFSIGKVFASCVEIENFVVPWSMKRPRVSALSAGSVFELKFSSALTDDEKISLREKIYDGFGTRTEEGFGQLRLWQPAENFTKGEHNEEIHKPETFSADTISLAKKILTAHFSEQIRIFAYEDAKKLETQLRRGNFTHFFTRLSGILSSAGKENIRENFKTRLEQEIRSGSSFEDHMHNFYTANGKKFIDVFTGKAELPRKVHDLMNIPALAAVKGVIDFADKDFSDDEFFAEYLTNYFRFARKLAAGGDGRE